MVDSIDLDEIEVDDGEEDADSTYGDWLWRGEGDPDADPPWKLSTAADLDEQPGEPIEPADGEDAIDQHDGETEASDDASDESRSEMPGSDGRSADSADTVSDASVDAEAEAEDEPDRQPTPGVPRTSKGPVGVPTEKGGAGGGSSTGTADHSATPGSAGTADADATGGDETGPTPTPERATNHGDASTPDEMTMAITYEALNRLADPRFAIADARSWTDWIGIVGTVSTPAIKKFQRDTGIEIDFFGGSETGPAQRLADVTPDSMFYADRMVLVGVEANESIAEDAGWEFVPLEKAADKAGWEIEHAE